jgi:hypothetical protein
MGRELCPGAGTESHRLDELLGGTGIVAGTDAFNHGTNPSSNFLKHRRHSWVMREQGKQRRLVHDKPSEEFGMLASQPECD